MSNIVQAPRQALNVARNAAAAQLSLNRGVTTAVPTTVTGPNVVTSQARAFGTSTKTVYVAPVEAKVPAADMWSVSSVKENLHGHLNIIGSRIPGFAYAEAWFPTENGKDFVAGEYFLSAELAENYATAARENVGRVEHATEMSEIARAASTQKCVVMPEVGKGQVYHGFVEQTPVFKTGIVVPIVNEGKVYAVLRLYSTSDAKINPDDVLHVAKGVVAAEIYGNTTNYKALDFIQHHPEVPLDIQRDVYFNIVSSGVFSAGRAFAEVDYFFKMGVAPIYFQRFNPKVLANHIQAFVASKQFAQASSSPDAMWLAIENNVRFMGGLPPEQSLHMVPNEPEKLVAVERNITRRIKKIPSNKAYAVEMSVSSEPYAVGASNTMALYTLQTHEYAVPANQGKEELTNLNDIASTHFLHEKTPLILERYQEIINEAANNLSPIAKVYPTYRDGTIPLMFAFRFSDHAGATSEYMLNLTQLLQANNLQPQRKFIETFANNIIVFSIYIKPSSASQAQISNLMKQFSMLHLTPPSEVLTPRFLDGSLSAEEYTYLSATSKLLFYVISSRPDEYNTLSKHFKDDMLNLGRLRNLYTSIRREAVSHSRIMKTFLKYPELVHKIYKDFELRQTTDQIKNGVIPPNAALEAEVQRTVVGNMESQIFHALLSFNLNVPKTNFYRPHKSAISFRLEPQFFADMDLPRLPYGVFFAMGAEFQGFHVRFADVSRGGIRLIRSRDDQAYNKNVASQFQETFNLAFTQNLKNKDIPEFGSKGTVLLNPDAQNQGLISFKRFVSSLLDIIVFDPEAKPGDSNYVVNNYGREELLFLGPDEGTAGVMEWAAYYAKKRGFPHWRAFTTGKPASLGGIPHDTFGMTTTSVRRYVMGCIEKLGLKAEECTKVQTGGPDGDLGSNEILLAKEKTIAVIDGSGVCYDPEGLNREELVRLAGQRVMIENFDKSKLSPAGFFVGVNDVDVTLPNGDKVESGVNFRNDFHLHPLCRADLFVPCGGRPESINLSNVKNLFDSKTGKPKFRVIVEGANLFVTQDARMVLEEAGVVLYKDASANKGGVTSSSLEVLAALSVPDDVFAEHMAVKDGVVPDFYLSYVKEIQDRITDNAGHEFECIWREHLRTGLPRFLLTDRVSNKINQLNDMVHASNLYDNKALRKVVLTEALPQRLQELVGLDTILANAPDSYIKAIFSAYLSSRYIYRYGIDATEFEFFEFMQSYLLRSTQEA